LKYQQAYPEVQKSCLVIDLHFKQELTLRLYEQGILKFGKARQLAGLTKWQFHRIFGKEKIVRSYDVEDLSNDLKTLEMPE